MEIIEGILTRKSVRSFSNKEVDNETLTTILKAGMAAPSGVNKQPWKFVVVKNKEKRAEVIKAMPFGKYESPIIIVPCIKELATMPMMHDLAYCDLSAATENILLAAHGLGLGAVWCAVCPSKQRAKQIKKVLGLPLGLTPFSCIYFGYPSENDKSKIKDKYNTDNIQIIE